MTKIEISTRKFEASHGRRPSGKGSWGFIVMADGREIDSFFTPRPMLLLTDGKRWAQSHARKTYADELKLQDLSLEVAP